ncbi:hypothetical protein JB92DRAFT_2862109 [Gautieria morchelliformis]|nr:hypothetical protein JB92DRAFT_2862109 [Gautieria morchelliformis]
MSAETTNVLKSMPVSRRLITGHDNNGKSKVLYDDAKGKSIVTPNGTTRIHNVWLTESVPADCSSKTSEDLTPNKPFGSPNDGSVCSVVTMVPGSKSPMHRTKTIDYGIVLEGVLELELDNGDKRILTAGDVIVQRGTMHAFRNPHSTNFAKFFCVVIASN